MLMMEKIIKTVTGYFMKDKGKGTVYRELLIQSDFEDIDLIIEKGIPQYNNEAEIQEGNEETLSEVKDCEALVKSQELSTERQMIQANIDEDYVTCELKGEMKEPIVKDKHEHFKNVGVQVNVSDDKLKESKLREKETEIKDTRKTNEPCIVFDYFQNNYNELDDLQFTPIQMDNEPDFCWFGETFSIIHDDNIETVPANARNTYKLLCLATLCVKICLLIYFIYHIRVMMGGYLYYLNNTGASLKINVTEKAGYIKDFKILEYQADFKKITETEPYEWHPFLEWWVYLVMALSLFIVCVLVNYIVKRVNDVRMEERLVTLYQKTSKATQVHGLLIEQEIKKLPEISQQPSIGISMIFTKEDNRKLNCFEENPIKIQEVDSAEDRKVLKSKANSVISIFKNSNFAHSKTLDTCDKGNVRINSRYKVQASNASAHACSVREPIIPTGDVKITMKSVDELKMDYFKDGHQLCEEMTTLKEVNTSQEGPPVSETVLGKKDPEYLEQALSFSDINNTLSNKPSLTAIPERTRDNSGSSIKTSLLQITSSKTLIRLSSHREVDTEKLSETRDTQVQNTEVMNDSTRNDESTTTVVNYPAQIVTDFMEDIYNKIELLDMVKSIEKNINIYEIRE